MERDNGNYYTDLDSLDRSGELIPGNTSAQGNHMQEEPAQDKSSKEKSGKPFQKGILVGMLAAGLIFLAGYGIGYLLNFWSGDGVQTAATSDGDSVVTDDVITKMQTIETLIRYYYYQDEDIDDESLEAGIYDGLIASLGDIYSDYYTAEEFEELMQETEGVYYGIGAGVSLDSVTSYPKIVKVYSNTPAEEAGLRENDIIYEVNGESTYGKTTTEVVAEIKGEEGTFVTLTIYREGESDYLYIDVERRQINTPTVEYEMLSDTIAYIQISEFSDTTSDQFATAMAYARENGMEGLILDLRSNPGGTLSGVVAVAQQLLPSGLIVYTENKYGYRTEYTCDGSNEIDVPMVVLVNGNSASAAEILAGAIQDYGIGTLLGTTTYGKGIVQSVLPLTDGSAVKLTVSSYFTPNGNNIHGTGIEPDVVVEFDSEAYYDAEDPSDNQLIAAQNLLEEMMAE